MLKKSDFLALTLGLSLLASPAFAQEGGGREKGPDGGKMFEKIDKDKKGYVTKEDMLAFHKERIDEMFKELDVDKDGKLTREELAKGREKMREKMRERLKERKENREDGRPEKQEDKN